MRLGVLWGTRRRSLPFVIRKDLRQWARRDIGAILPGRGVELILNPFVVDARLLRLRLRLLVGVRIRLPLLLKLVLDVLLPRSPESAKAVQGRRKK